MRKLFGLMGCLAVAGVMPGCNNTFLGPDIFGSDNRFNIVGSGNVVSESRSVSGFDSVAFSGAGRLVLEQTGTESLTIRADDNLLPLMVSEVHNGELRIGLSTDGSVSTTHEILFRLSVERLVGLTVSGAVSVDASAIDTDNLDVQVSGASSVVAEGRADEQKVVVSGASAYDAEDLLSRVVEVEASGASAVILNVSERLFARVSGASSVVYIGDPDVTVEGPPGLVRQR